MSAAYSSEWQFFTSIQQVHEPTEEGEAPPSAVRESPKFLPGHRETRLPLAPSDIARVHTQLTPASTDVEIGAVLRELPVPAAEESPTHASALSLGRRSCRFCSSHRTSHPPMEISAFNVPLLVRFVNALGMIKPRRQTFVCAKHQRKLRSAIRRAVHLGFFSYKDNTFRVHSPYAASVVLPDPHTGELLVQKRGTPNDRATPQ